MKHTSGEWYYNALEGKIRSGDQGIICNIIDGTKTDQEIGANGALIASAPELLETCQKALRYFERNINELYLKDDPKIIALRKAIKKATL